MILKSKTYEVELNEYMAKASKWHSWFAWYPVRISDKELVLFQKVKRKAVGFSSFNSPYWIYEL